MAKPADQVFGQAASDAAAGLSRTAAVPEESAESGIESVRTDFPCSVGQERFWLLDRLDPGNSAYNVAVRWRLQGRVLTDVLQQAWLAIIERHEILRSIFLEVAGSPIQRVTPEAKFRLHEIDLSALPPETQQAEADRIGMIEARAPFDLSTGPVLRVTLLRFSPSVAIILVTTHQIVSDGWSIGVMAREMGVIYHALRHGEPPALEPLSIQYADYSLWQLEWLRVRGTDAETAYWSKQLAGVKPFRVAPDHARPNRPSTNGAIASRVLPRELTNRAQLLSAERGATLFATALAALCAMLARYTQETDIVLGTQVSDREQVELEPMIGQFVNSLILRNDLAGNPPFGAIIDAVKDTVAQALDHRHIPIEKLLGMVKGDRSHANSPSISVNFIFQKTFIQNTSYEDFDLIDMPSLPTGAIYDLNFFMVERPDGWRFSCQYNTDQFDTATAERLLGYYQTLLESAVAGAGQRLSELVLAPPNEVRTLLNKLNDTRSLYPRDLTLGKLFEAQAARAPAALGLICGDRQLSFGDINAAANRMAAYLRHRGIGPGARVGVCLPRSAEFPICLLGLLKAGAAVLALDCGDPPQYRAAVLRSARATAIIGQELQTLSMLEPSIARIEIEAALAFGASPGNVTLPPQDASSAALLVFTGSNRNPVLGVSHRSVSNLVCSMAKRPGLNDRDVAVATSPFGLDRALFEILFPLLTGARLVLALDREVGGGRALLSLLQRVGATSMYANAHVWRTLVEAGWTGYPALKMLCSAQELTTGLAERLAAVGGELWSLYGHPGSGIWSAAHLNVARHSITEIGEPIANTTLQVLDSSAQAAPVGGIGEICVGGDGVSPSAGHDATPNLYRTGDIGRLKTDGRIEYLGRQDAKFEHLGYSVDPAAIEAVLLKHQRVAEACVVPSVQASGPDLIAAHVVVHGSPAPLAPDGVLDELKTCLERSLPRALVPQRIVVHAKLPRLASGEIDRRALHAHRIREPGGDGQKLSGDTEKRLAVIWSSMLGIPSVASTDNFFELGGHSLLAARMLTQVEHVFSRRVKLATLFSAPTLHEFAKVLAEEDLREFDFRQVVKIQPNGVKAPLIVINNTGIYYGLAKFLGGEQPVYSLQLFDPSVTYTAMPSTLEEIAARYVELIKRVQPQGPYALMGWCVAGALAFEVACQLSAANDRVSHLFLMDSWVPRYLARLPWPRRAIGDYSLRLQFIFDDWKRIFAGKGTVFQDVLKFLKNRKLFMKMQRSISGATPGPGQTEIAPNQLATVVDYDQWLLRYLQDVTSRYEPKVYSGKITLFRSRREPTGLWFDPNAGWASFTSRGVELFMLDGNHFTMFQAPGVVQMATHIRAALEADSPAPAEQQFLPHSGQAAHAIQSGK